MITSLRTVAVLLGFLGLLVWGFFSNPFAYRTENVASSEREPALRDNFYDVAMHGDVVRVVGYHGTILRSRDRGLRWELQPSGTTEALFRVSMIDENKAWVSGSYGTILHTRDGGKSWQKQQVPSEEHLFGLNFINERQGWAVGNRGTVLGTEDGGATWVDYSIGEDVVLNDVRFLDAKRGWIVGEFGRIYHSQDGGITWAKQKSPIEVPFASGASRNLFRLLLSNSHAGWAFGLDGVILSTRDGKKWEVLRPDDHSSPDAKRYHLFAASAAGAEKWAVGERGTVLVSAISDKRWEPASSKSSLSNLNGVAFGENEAGLIVGNRGVILRTDDGGKRWTLVRIAHKAPTDGAS